LKNGRSREHCIWSSTLRYFYYFTISPVPWWWWW
jgi:hypothetical protein